METELAGSAKPPAENPTRPMRCLYVLTSSQFGGGNRSMETLWLGLDRLGVKPWVVCPGPPRASSS